MLHVLTPRTPLAVLLVTLLVGCSITVSESSPTPAMPPSMWPRVPELGDAHRALLLTVEDVPEGWSQVPQSETGRSRDIVCDVDLIPIAPAAAGRAVFRGPSAAGLAVSEFVEVYPGDEASGIVSDLSQALTTCDSYQAYYTEDDGSVRWVPVTVEHVDNLSDLPGAVMWRQESSAGLTMTSYVAIAAQDGAAVTIAVTGLSPDDALEETAEYYMRTVLSD